VQVAGFGDSVKTGLAAIEAHQPDVVFLDVEMPYGNAFDLLEQAGEIGVRNGVRDGLRPLRPQGPQLQRGLLPAQTHRH
jgi:CheY-like chemotaxis protein